MCLEKSAWGKVCDTSYTLVHILSEQEVAKTLGKRQTQFFILKNVAIWSGYAVLCDFVTVGCIASCIFICSFL